MQTKIKRYGNGNAHLNVLSVIMKYYKILFGTSTIMMRIKTVGLNVQYVIMIV